MLSFVSTAYLLLLQSNTLEESEGEGCRNMLRCRKIPVSSGNLFFKYWHRQSGISANLNQSVDDNVINIIKTTGFILMSSSLSDPPFRCLTSVRHILFWFAFNHDRCSKINLKNVKVVTYVRTHNHSLFWECEQTSQVLFFSRESCCQLGLCN